MSENNAVVKTEAANDLAAAVEAVVATGDLSKMSPRQRVEYYGAVCRSLGLNHLTRPFQYIVLNGRLTLYATRDATDQLRKLHRVSIQITSRERVDDVYVVTARATLPDGRNDESVGAVPIANLKGDALANALMKAECVPLDSEILTRDGYKRYNQVTVGEEVLAYDCESDTCKWTPLREVTVYDQAPVARFHVDTVSFWCTPDHSWVVENESAGRRLVKAQDITPADRVILASPVEGGAGGAPGLRWLEGGPARRDELVVRAYTGMTIEGPEAVPEAVWCPTTDYGTWVMRQGGVVTITGNTKAKRRATLSLVGLGWLDETEIGSIPDARVVQVTESGEIEDEMQEPKVQELKAAQDDDAPDYLSDRERQNKLRAYLTGEGLTRARADDLIAEWCAAGLSRRQIQEAVRTVLSEGGAA